MDFIMLGHDMYFLIATYIYDDILAGKYERVFDLTSYCRSSISIYYKCYQLIINSRELYIVKIYNEFILKTRKKIANCKRPMDIQMQQLVFSQLYDMIYDYRYVLYACVAFRKNSRNKLVFAILQAYKRLISQNSDFDKNCSKFGRVLVRVRIIVGEDYGKLLNTIL